MAELSIKITDIPDNYCKMIEQIVRRTIAFTDISPLSSSNEIVISIIDVLAVDRDCADEIFAELLTNASVLGCMSQSAKIEEVVCELTKMEE